MIRTGPFNIKGETSSKSHGGTGEYFVRTLLTKEFSSTLKYVRELTLNEGSSIGLHEHTDDEEIYYVIAGSGIMTVDDEQEEVREGEIVLTKSGSRHGLLNTGPGPLKIFVACAGVQPDIK